MEGSCSTSSKYNSAFWLVKSQKWLCFRFPPWDAWAAQWHEFPHQLLHSHIKAVSEAVTPLPHTLPWLGWLNWEPHYVYHNNRWKIKSKVLCMCYTILVHCFEGAKSTLPYRGGWVQLKNYVSKLLWSALEIQKNKCTHNRSTWHLTAQGSETNQMWCLNTAGGKCSFVVGFFPSKSS